MSHAVKVVALRGVCIGPSQHLLPGGEADVDNLTARWLADAGLVQLAPEAPVAEAAPAPAPRKRRAAAAAAAAPKTDAAPSANADPDEPEGADEAPNPEGV
jgi:hypothetical protein